MLSKADYIFTALNSRLEAYFNLKKIIRNLKGLSSRYDIFDTLVLLLFFSNFFLYIFLLNSTYEYLCPFNGYDKGIMYQLFHNTVVHNHFFYSSINGGGIIDFVGHQRYVFLLILPFFYVYPHPITFSIISSFLLSLGAFPVYWLANEVSKSKKISLVSVIMYFLHPTVSWLFLESVKEEIFALPFLLFSFYYMYIKSFNKFLFFLFLACICKENIPLVAIMFGVYAFVENYDKKWVYTPLILGIGIFSFELLYLKPYFADLSHQLYGYVLISETGMLAGRYSYLGTSVTDVIFNLLTNPQLLFKYMFTQESLNYLLILFLPVGYICFFKPKVLLIASPVFLQNLLANFSAQRMISFHYSAVIIFVIICSAIFSLSSINKKISTKKFNLVLIILISLSLYSFSVYGGVGKAISDIDSAQKDVAQEFLKNISRIPGNSSILCSEEMGCYFYRNLKVTYIGLGYFQKDRLDSYDYVIIKKPALTSYDLYRNINSLLENHNLYYLDNSNFVFEKHNQSLEPSSLGDDNFIYNNLFFHSQNTTGSLIYDEKIGKYSFYSDKNFSEPGYLVYGPYITLPEGEYIIEYILKAEDINNASPSIASIDISYIKNGEQRVDSTKDIYSNDLIEGQYCSQNLTLNIENYEDSTLFEFRVFQPLSSDLYVERIIIHKCM
jgi:uncharacterized membrane protein